MYYRRKVILALLQKFNGKLSNTRLQKLLFLFTLHQSHSEPSKRSFDFVPYQYGCFSFTANQDLFTLSKYGIVVQDKSEKFSNHRSSYWKLKSNEDFLVQLKEKDRNILGHVKSNYGTLSKDELIRLTYLEYPYYAIKSKIANTLLNGIELQLINNQKINETEKQLFTIGYEGISFENYLNKLIINNIQILCDVRKNPLSMKYGFSKSQLQNACKSLDITYLHIPELGIEAKKRKNLENLTSYNKLFEEYERTTLKENSSYVKKIADLFSKYNRVALTCFEKEVCMCHRGKVAKCLEELPDWKIPIKHL